MGSRSSVPYRSRHVGARLGGARLFTAAGALALALTGCGARTPLEDAELYPEPSPRGEPGKGGPAGGETCEPCGPFVECTACFVQGQPSTYRCAPDDALGECLHLQESHVDSVGVAYTCFYCAASL
jgi:hypothetical protein